jgi:hypothetical protein
LARLFKAFSKKASTATHERLSQDDEITGSSDRALGLVFAGVFTIFGLWPLFGGHGPRLWCLAVALLFGAVALLRPALLKPLNRLWTRFGLLLHRLVNPIIMALLFYVTITPIGLAMRLLGKDFLKLRLEADRKSYWIERRPPGPAPDTMKYQF